MSRRATLISALIVSASLIAGSPAYAGGRGPGHGPGQPGAPGVGDPYFPDAGNGGYDARHYDLALAWDPTTKRLDGTVSIQARATQSLSSFDLDFRTLAISRLTVDGRSATYTRSGQELVVTPRHAIRRGEHFTVRVTYGGVPEAVIDPDGSLDGWIATDDGVFVANEPQGSPSWFPVNDHPTDKATYTVRMTVPKDLSAVGNGTLVKQRTRAGRTTFVWDERYPMASYLATITIGKFQITRGRARHGLPLYLAVDPREAADSADALARLPEIIAYEESVFGRYPFESAGAIVDQAPDVGYALESQTKPVYDRAPDVATVVHEMAHQWFGDSVSLTSWKDIWLNEGFAGYAEWLWSEHTGEETAQQIFDDDYATPASRTGFWNPPPGNPGSGEFIFDGTVYERGAMTLQALRVKIGDHAFFEVLRDWASIHRYGNASTDDFIRLAEHVSHRNLDAFFTTWLYTAGKPTSW